MGSTLELKSFEDFGSRLENEDLFCKQGLLNGQWTNASSGKTFPVWEPSSGKVLRQCADFSKAEFVQAIESAEKGYRAFYKSTTARERSQILKNWADLIMANKKDCVCLLKVFDTLTDEIDYYSGHNTLSGKRENSCRG